MIAIWTKKNVRQHLIEQEGSKINGCAVLKSVNTFLKFKYDKNLDVQKIVNCSKTK